MKNLSILKNIFVGAARLIARRIKIILLLILIGTVVWFAFDYVKAKKQAKLLLDPTARQETRIEKEQKEIQRIVAQVSKLIILPEGDPKFATIQDATALTKEQPFFTNAENGDKILIYKNKAIIFSPAKNMLVNVGPVYVQNSQNTSTSNSASQVTSPETRYVTIEIRNGTEVDGAANTMASKLGVLAGYKIANITDAAKQDYKKTILVNLSGKNIDSLEKKLGINVAVGALPNGEMASQADVVVIIGDGEKSLLNSG